MADVRGTPAGRFGQDDAKQVGVDAIIPTIAALFVYFLGKSVEMTGEVEKSLIVVVVVLVSAGLKWLRNTQRREVKE